MFEAELYKVLSSEKQIISLIQNYRGKPAIFAGGVPGDADLPYIAFDIAPSIAASPETMKFNIMIDYWERGQSRANAAQIAQLIENLLDMKALESERYSCVRFFIFRSSFIPDPDPRVIHYNLQFTARAGRKTFINSLSN